MGGYSPARCETVIWRNRLVCKHSVPKLEAWAKGAGAAFRVTPIQGCYSTAVALSANTHAGGGVYDVEGDGYSFETFTAGVNSGRKALLATFGRWWAGNHHIHLIDPECPNLHPSAEEQMEQFRRGETGLVGYDPDEWDRSTASAIMAAYDARHSSPSKASSYTIPKGGTLGKAAIALGTTVALLAAYNGIRDPNVVQPGQTVERPPSNYSAPAKPGPAPAPARPAPAPAKPAPAPSSSSSSFRPIPGQTAAYLNLLRPGSSNSTSVYLYEKALARSGYLSSAYVDGYYGTATTAATQRAYRKLGTTPNATWPGPYLLRTLGVPVVGAPAAPAPKAASNGFRPIASQHGAYLNLLRPGVNNSTSVYRYEYALAKDGRLAWRWVDGYYGTATSAATKSAYRALGVTPNATRPGPYLLNRLGVPSL